MAGDDWITIAWAVVMLVALASAVAARRVPLGQLARLAALWLVILGAVYLGFVYREELRGIGQRVLADVQPDAPRMVGEAVHIQQSLDGHFWVRATVDGVPVRFLVDSGATMTAVSQQVIEDARLQPERWRPGGVVTTANGTVRVRRVTIGRLEAGGIVRHDLGAVTAPEFGTMNVLGMNFLSSLESWTVRGNTLVLTP